MAPAAHLTITLVLHHHGWTVLAQLPSSRFQMEGLKLQRMLPFAVEIVLLEMCQFSNRAAILNRLPVKVQNTPGGHRTEQLPCFHSVSTPTAAGSTCGLNDFIHPQRTVTSHCSGFRFSPHWKFLCTPLVSS